MPALSSIVWHVDNYVVIKQTESNGPLVLFWGLLDGFNSWSCFAKYANLQLGLLQPVCVCVCVCVHGQAAWACHCNKRSKHKMSSAAGQRHGWKMVSVTCPLFLLKILELVSLASSTAVIW